MLKGALRLSALKKNQSGRDSIFCAGNTNGICYFFTPDGRVAEKRGQQEYATDKKVAKIESILLFVISIVDRF